MTPQPTSLSPATFPERVRAEMGQRATGIVAALLLEALLLLLLLSLGRAGASRDEEITFVDFKAIDASSDAAEEPIEKTETEPRAVEEAAPQPADTAAADVFPVPQTPAAPAVAPPTPPTVRQPDPRYGPGPRPIQNPPPAGPAFGPANTGRVEGDTARVGTAPNGEPLYAAAWYRKPYDDELRGYLSTATGPGWGLIACRTAPNYRVEDCIGLEESPRGSRIMNAVLAAAWQFKVRPPRLGGKPQIGEWVRIRIDYNLQPAG